MNKLSILAAALIAGTALTAQAAPADDALNKDIAALARLLRVLSGMYDQAARSAASL